MKYIIVLLFIILLVDCASISNKETSSLVASGQMLLDSTYLSSRVSYFTMDDKKWDGSGAKVLEEYMNKSQFIVLGEFHGSSKISEFTKRMIPKLHTIGFDKFACEIGPHSGKEIQHLIQEHEKTVPSLYSFNSEYYFKEIDDIPIPFFDGIEDAEFAQQLGQYQFDIWGLDQEYFSGVFFLFDKIASHHPNDRNIQRLKIASDSIARYWILEDDKEEIEGGVFRKILEEPTVQRFFDIAEQEHQGSKSIIEDLKISWDIYNRYKGGASHNDRANYIKDNFDKNFEGTEQSKVLVKFGQLHATQDGSETEDIGFHLEQIARKRGTYCTNIALWNKYYSEGGKIVDLAETSRFYQSYHPFTAFGKRNEWGIIDLAKIRKEWKDGKIIIPEGKNKVRLERLLNGFDLYIILPVDKRVKPNYEF